MRAAGRGRAHGVPTMSGYPAEPVLGKRKRSVAQRFDPAEPAQRGRRRSTEQAERRKSAQVFRSDAAPAAVALPVSQEQQHDDATAAAATNAAWQPRRDRRKRKRPGRQDKAFDPSKRRRGSWLDTPTKARPIL